MYSLAKKTLLLLLLALTLFFSGCATVGSSKGQPSASAIEQPLQPAFESPAWLTEEFLMPAGDDPLEGFNRTMHGTNVWLTTKMLSPLARGWRFVIPAYARERLTCFDHNLHSPLLFVTHALQAEWGECGVDVGRFLINTTVGILGLWDPAEKVWGIRRAPGGFDSTLDAWNVGNGPAMTLPILGNGTVRSQGAAGLDALCNWTSWVFDASLVWPYVVRGVLAFNGFSNAEPMLTGMATSHPYNYMLANFFDWYKRTAEHTRFQYDAQNPAWGADPSLGMLALKPSGESIANSTRHRTARLKQGFVPFSCWPDKEARQLVVILPGIGTHRQQDSVLALAELFRAHGCAVMAFSSPFAPDYFRHLQNGGAPAGFIPEDAKTMARFLRAALDNYRARYRNADKQEVTVVGYSLGGLNALFMAAAEEDDGMLEPGLDIRRYVAINPPFDPYGAVMEVDKLFALPDKWHPGDTAAAEAHVSDLMMRLLCWASPGRYNPPSPVPPITFEESRFLIGLNMRLTLADCLQAQQELRPTGLFAGDPTSFFHRNAIARQALGCPFDAYLKKVLLPWWQKSGYGDATAEDMAARCRLDAIEAKLAANKKVFVFQNRDDLLLKDGEIDWYSATFGDRAIIFDQGGHLGNMAHPAFQQQLLQTTLLKQQ